MEKFRNKFKISKNGFTLAEVLITLVIVGVIAAMTIPTVINNTKKQEYVSRLKKTYSALSQASAKIIAEEGSAVNWATSTETIYNLLKKNLVNVKECGTGSGCFQGEYKWKDNTTAHDFDSANRYKFTLADGAFVSMTKDYGDFSSTCSANLSGSVNVCQIILVDINGAKKPNKVGQDTFAFVLKNDGLYPTGCDSDGCSNINGWGCTCKVLRENAINY